MLRGWACSLFVLPFLFFSSFLLLLAFCLQWWKSLGKLYVRFFSFLFFPRLVILPRAFPFNDIHARGLKRGRGEEVRIPGENICASWMYFLGRCYRLSAFGLRDDVPCACPTYINLAAPQPPPHAPTPTDEHCDIVIISFFILPAFPLFLTFRSVILLTRSLVR